MGGRPPAHRRDRPQRRPGRTAQRDPRGDVDRRARHDANYVECAAGGLSQMKEDKEIKAENIMFFYQPSP